MEIFVFLYLFFCEINLDCELVFSQEDQIKIFYLVSQTLWHSEDKSRTNSPDSNGIFYLATICVAKHLLVVQCTWCASDGEVFRVLFVPHVLTNETEALCNLEVNDIAAYSQSRTVCTIASHNHYTMIKCRLRNLPISHLRDSAKTWLKHGWGIYFLLVM